MLNFIKVFSGKKEESEVRTAKEEAKKMLDNARKKRKKILNQANAEAKEKGEKIISEAKKRAARITAKPEEELQKAKTQIIDLTRQLREMENLREENGQLSTKLREQAQKLRKRDEKIDELKLRLERKGQQRKSRF